MKLSRREIILAAAALPQAAPAQSVADPAAEARETNLRNGEALAKVALPRSTEPAFQFRA